MGGLPLGLDGRGPESSCASLGRLVEAGNALGFSATETTRPPVAPVNMTSLRLLAPAFKSGIYRRFCPGFVVLQHVGRRGRDRRGGVLRAHEGHRQRSARWLHVPAPGALVKATRFWRFIDAATGRATPPRAQPDISALTAPAPICPPSHPPFHSRQNRPTLSASLKRKDPRSR
jgi:hypothetical protein